MTTDDFARAVLARVRYREWTEFTPWFLAKGAQLKCSIVGYLPRHKRTNSKPDALGIFHDRPHEDLRGVRPVRAVRYMPCVKGATMALGGEKESER